MGNTITTTDSTFESDVINSDTPVLVDFWAEWCGPCKMIAPTLEELSTEMADDLVIAKMDIDADQSTPQSFGVMSIPTLMLFKNGQPVERIVGVTPKAQLVSKLTPHLG